MSADSERPGSESFDSRPMMRIIPDDVDHPGHYAATHAPGRKWVTDPVTRRLAISYVKTISDDDGSTS